MTKRNLPSLSTGGLQKAIISFLGHGFDESAKSAFSEVKPLSIFDFSDFNTKIIEVNGTEYTVPEFVDALPNTGVEESDGCEESIATVSESLAASTNMSANYGCFHGGLSAAYQKSHTASSSSLYAYFFASVNLADFCISSIDEKYLSADFRADVKNLPESVDESNFEDFLSFFKKYGVYYVNKISAGGRVHLYNSVVANSGSDSESAKADIHAQYKGLFFSGSLDASISKSESWSNYSKNSRTVLEARGGTTEAISALVGIDPVAPDATTKAKYELWVQSVGQSPIATKTEVGQVADLCGDKRAAVAEAAGTFLTSINFLTYLKSDDPWKGYGSWTFTGSVYVNGAKVEVDDGGRAGYQVVVFNRYNHKKLFWSKFYPLDLENWQASVQPMYDQMTSDLSEGKNKDSANTVIIRSQNLPITCYPSESFLGYLRSTLAADDKIFQEWKDKNKNGSYIEGNIPYFIVGCPNATNSSGKGSTSHISIISLAASFPASAAKLKRILVTTVQEEAKGAVAPDFITSYLTNIEYL